MSGYLIGPSGVAPVLTVSSLVYTSTDVSKVWQASTTFASCNIGSVTADRVIVVSIGIDSNAANSLTSVTIGGVTATFGVQTVNSQGANIYIYYLVAPSGVLNTATDTIVITPIGAATQLVIAVGTVTGSTTTTLDSTQGSATYHLIADPRGVADWPGALSISANGTAAICGMIDRSTTMVATSSNTVVDLNAVETGGQTFEFMGAHGTNGSPTFTGANNFNATFAAVSFKP